MSVSESTKPPNFGNSDENFEQADVPAKHTQKSINLLKANADQFAQKYSELELYWYCKHEANYWRPPTDQVEILFHAVI